MGHYKVGSTKSPDWPKLGPSLVIATSVILAIRTAKWPTVLRGYQVATPELDEEVHFAADLASKVLSHLLAHREDLFPTVEVPVVAPDDEDVPK